MMIKPDRLPDDQLYSKEKLMNASNNDRVFVRTMLEVFVDQVSSETLPRLKEACLNADFEAIHAIVHRSKPSVRSICHPDIAGLLLSIEEQANRREATGLYEKIVFFSSQMNRVIALILEKEIRNS